MINILTEDEAQKRIAYLIKLNEKDKPAMVRGDRKAMLRILDRCNEIDRIKYLNA